MTFFARIIEFRHPLMEALIAIASCALILMEMILFLILREMLLLFKCLALTSGKIALQTILALFSLEK